MFFDIVVFVPINSKDIVFVIIISKLQSISIMCVENIFDKFNKIYDFNGLEKGK